MTELHYISRWKNCLDELSQLVQPMDSVMHCRLQPSNNPGPQGDILARMIKIFPLKSTGAYVDVGASHPCECSNTWPYYQAGWRGLLIEPFEGFWYSLLRNRRGDILEPVGAFNCDGIANLRISGNVSSFRPDWNIQEDSIRPTEIETLKTILSRYPDIRDACKFCSIDTEGTEPQVLDGIDWDTFHPEVFIIEYRTYEGTAVNGEPQLMGSDESEPLYERLKPHGYVEICRNDLNVIYGTQDAYKRYHGQENVPTT